MSETAFAPAPTEAQPVMVVEVDPAIELIGEPVEHTEAPLVVEIDNNADQTETTSDKKSLAYRAGHKLGVRRAVKAAKATAAASTRPIDPILAEQFDVNNAQSTNAEDLNTEYDFSGLSDSELDDLLLTDDIVNDQSKFHAAGRESANRQEAKVQQTFAELDADIASKQLSTGSLKAEGRVIRTYLNDEGKPLAGFAELNTELARKVAEGNDTDWDNLVQTLRDAVKSDANNRDVSTEDRLKTFEAYASKKYKELMAKKQDGSVVVLPIVEQTPQVEKENKKRGRKVAAGLLAAGLLVGGIFGAKKLADEDTSSVKDKGTNELTTGGKLQGPEYNPTADAGDTSNKSDETIKTPENLDITDWTWNVAHNLQPGNETGLIQAGIDAYNMANSTDFAFRAKNGTTMIVNGQGRIVNPTEMEYINQLMINAA